MGQKILIIEDEIHLAEGLKLNLTLQGYEAEVADNGLKALELFEQGDWNLILVDLMLPGVDGEEIIRRIRLNDEKIPILVLSAKDQSIEKVKCLELGVDDYQTKPFVLDELLLRVKRLIKRSEWGNREDEMEKNKKFEYVFGKNRVNFLQTTASTPQGDLSLTIQELKVLKLFFENPEKALSREELLSKGWGIENVSSRTVDNFIVRLRKYFEEEPSNPRYFISVRGLGYRYSPPEGAKFIMD